MSEATSQAKRFYTTRELADLLGVVPSTVHRWVHEGRLPPPLRPGPKTLRWPAEVVHAAINEMYQTTQGK